MAKANEQKPEAAIREVAVQCPYCGKSTSIVPAEDFRPIYVYCGVCGQRFIAERVRDGMEVLKIENAPPLDDPDRREIELSLGDEE